MRIIADRDGMYIYRENDAVHDEYSTPDIAIGWEGTMDLHLERGYVDVKQAREYIRMIEQAITMVEEQGQQVGY